MSYNPLRLFPYAPFTEPLPIPSAAPTAGNLVCLELNREWLPYVLGALEVYRWEDAWDAQGAALLQTLGWVQDLLYLLASAYGVCMDGVTDISIDGCNLTVTYNDAPSKTIDLTECAVPGPAGPTGATGATGATGPAGLDGASVELRIEGGFIQWRQDDDSPTWTNLIALADLKGDKGDPGDVNVPTPIPDDTGRDRQCGSAQRLADVFWDSLDDSLDATDASIDVPDLINVIWNVFNPVVGLDQLFQIAQDFTGYNTTTVRAEMTSTAKNGFTEWLFCNEVPADPTIIGDWWRDDFTGGTELAGFAETLARMIPQTTYETAKGLGSSAPSADCETLWGANCPGGSLPVLVTFDGLNYTNWTVNQVTQIVGFGNPDFSLEALAGQQDTSGFIADILVDLGSDETVNGVRFDFWWDSPVSSIALDVELLDSGMNQLYFDRVFNPQAKRIWLTQSWSSLAIAGVRFVRVVAQRGYIANRGGVYFDNIEIT